MDRGSGILVEVSVPNQRVEVGMIAMSRRKRTRKLDTLQDHALLGFAGAATSEGMWGQMIALNVARICARFKFGSKRRRSTLTTASSR
jgi:hypothetical protein